MKLSDLTPDNRNANKGTAKGQKAIVNSIQRSGAGRSIVVDKHGQIIGGNKTAEAIAEVFGAETEVQVIETDGKRLLVHKRTDLDLSDPSPNNPARQLAYADNLTSWASFELDPAQVMADIEAGFDFEAVDISLPDLGELLGKAANELLAGDNSGQDTEPEIDKAEELRVKWGVEPGQLWQLGDHRLICGDCTDPAVVARVMGGEKAALCVTDPPYGVEYADKNKWLNAISRGNRIQTPIENDHASKDDTQAMWKAAFEQMGNTLHPGGVVYCFMPQGGDQMMMMMMMMGAGIEPRHELIWLKNNHVLGRVDYAYKHEPILYAWKDGGHKFYGDFQTSILEYPKPLKSDMHPTMKPVPLIEKLTSNSSKPDEVVYEPFSGSGTTIIACENLGRRCRAIEISPGYVAVSLQRWADHTGKTPQLV